MASGARPSSPAGSDSRRDAPGSCYGAGDLRAAERAVLHVQNHLVRRPSPPRRRPTGRFRARFAAGAGPCARPRDDKSQVPAPLLVSAALVRASARVVSLEQAQRHRGGSPSGRKALASLSLDARGRRARAPRPRRPPPPLSPASSPSLCGFFFAREPPPTRTSAEVDVPRRFCPRRPRRARRPRRFFWRGCGASVSARATALHVRFVFEPLDGCNDGASAGRSGATQPPPERRASGVLDASTRSTRRSDDGWHMFSHVVAAHRREKRASVAASASVSAAKAKKSSSFCSRAPTAIAPHRRVAAQEASAFSPPPCLAPRSRWSRCVPDVRRGAARAKLGRQRAGRLAGATCSVPGGLPPGPPARRALPPASPARGGAPVWERRACDRRIRGPSRAPRSRVLALPIAARRRRPREHATRCACLSHAKSCTSSKPPALLGVNVRYKPSLFTRPSLPVDAVAVLSAAMPDKSRDDMPPRDACGDDTSP